MGITKREIASELGVSKRTVANYIEKLGLGNHVSRNGNTDFLDDFAAAAIADALKAQYDMDVDSKKLVIDEPIKSFGSYQVKAKLGYEISGLVNVLVCEAK